MGGLTLDFRLPMLPVVTHNRGSQEKWIVLGVCVVVWGSDGAPGGPRLLKWGPW